MLLRYPSNLYNLILYVSILIKQTLLDKVTKSEHTTEKVLRKRFYFFLTKAMIVLAHEMEVVVMMKCVSRTEFSCGFW